MSPLSDGADPLPDAAVLDAADPLAGFREAFVHADDEPDLIYLDGNSLGRLPRAAATLAAEVVEAQSVSYTHLRAHET